MPRERSVVFLLLAIVTVGMTVSLTGQTTRALTITVDSLTDDFSDDGKCSLREAIQNANDTSDGQPREDCSAGDPAGEDTITFSVQGVIVLSGQLPPIVDDLVLAGGNDISLDGDDGRILSVEAGASLTVEELAFQHGQAAAGGAIHVASGVLVVRSSQFMNNRADHGGAIDVADGDLSVSNSVFTGNEALGPGGAITIAEGSLRISGSTFTENVGGEGQGAGAIYAMNAPVTINGGEFNGNSVGPGGAGGAIIVEAALAIQGTGFHGNSAVSGGAIFVIEGPGVQISGASFSNNEATFYAGGAITALVPLQVTGSTFHDNSAPQGGAIAHDLATASVSTSVFTGNTATTLGGAAYLGTPEGATTVFRRNTYSENKAKNGGAVYAVQGSVHLLESTFSENSAIAGGAIYNTGTIEVLNSTISGNEGGGLLNEGDATVRHATFADNASVGVAGILNTPSASLSIANTAIATGEFGVNCELNGTVNGPPGSNLSDDGSCDVPAFVKVEALLLGPLANNGGPTFTHLPATGSPVIDAGNLGTCLSDDQRGEPRPTNAGCDIGAVEVEEVPFVPAGDLFLPNLAAQVDHP